MLHAVAFALADSVNGLLIGVVVALGIMLPRGTYRRVTPLLIAGDWTGVFSLAVLTMFVLDSLRDWVKLLEGSPILGWALVIIGLATVVLTWRSRPGEANALVDRILVPLRRPSPLTFATGFVLGVAQSITSAPFFIGLFHLAAGEFTSAVRYGGLVIYATLALSLPAVSAAFVGIVRSYPESPAGLLFIRARENKEQVAKAGGYLVAVFLIVMGVVSMPGVVG